LLDPELDPDLFAGQVDPDPKLGGKWDPDQKQIVSDPQHCKELSTGTSHLTTSQVKCVLAVKYKTIKGPKII
jgi:hypothetical protein